MGVGPHEECDHPPMAAGICSKSYLFQVELQMMLMTRSGDRGGNILFRHYLSVHSPSDPSRLHILLPLRSTRLSLASLPQSHRSQTRQDPLVPSPRSCHRPQNILHLCFGNLSRNHKWSYGEFLDDDLEELRIWAP
jgi:hypothetical protein